MENLGDALKNKLHEKGLNASYEALVNNVKADPEVKLFLSEHQSELAADAFEKSLAKLYEYYNVKQKLAKGIQSFAPGYEPILVVNDHLIDISYVPSKELVAKKQSLAINNRITAILMPKAIKEATISDFDATSERFEIMDQAITFIEEYVQSPDKFHKGMYIHGPFGTGKTFLIGAIANSLAKKGFSCTLIHFPSFAVKMKTAIATNTVGEKIDLIKKTPVLMIDDIGADSMSSWVRDEVLGVILEYRMQQQLPTFFTSNFSMAKLEEEHLGINQKGEYEPLKAKRLMQRVQFLASEVEMLGPNRRLEN